MVCWMLMFGLFFFTYRPEQKFREHIKEEPLESTAKKILKRDTASFDDKDDEVREW